MEEERRGAATGGSSHPSLCRMGCGFFGSAASEGMCSKCYRDQVRRKAEQRATTTSHTAVSPSSPPAPSPTPPSTRRHPPGHEECDHVEVRATRLSALTAPASLEPGDAKQTPKRNRCFVCRKKVGLTGFHCRCGDQFCALHRYADQHSCPFDYKASGREELQRRHPKVVAAKIQKL